MLKFKLLSYDGYPTKARALENHSIKTHHEIHENYITVLEKNAFFTHSYKTVTIIFYT